MAQEIKFKKKCSSCNGTGIDSPTYFEDRYEDNGCTSCGGSTSRSSWSGKVTAHRGSGEVYQIYAVTGNICKKCNGSGKYADLNKEMPWGVYRDCLFGTDEEKAFYRRQNEENRRRWIEQLKSNAKECDSCRGTGKELKYIKEVPA